MEQTPAHSYALKQLRFFSERKTSSWEDIAQISETVIATLPQAINSCRDLTLNYDVLEDYSILKNNGNLSSHDQFSEELPYSYGVFSDEGKAILFETITAMKNAGDFIRLYTWKPYMFLLGSMKNSVFILDTHPVHPSDGRKSTGILKVFKGMTDESSRSACAWLWHRLLCSRVRGVIVSSLQQS